MTELKLTYNFLKSAMCPEDVFGTLPLNIQTGYRTLSKAVHPDVNEDKELATKVFMLLTDIYSVAKRNCLEGTYGKRIAFEWKTPIQIDGVDVNKTPINGSISDLYKSPDVLVKVVRNHEDNDLMAAEVNALNILKNIVPPVNDGIPKLVRTFRTSGKWKRNVNVLEFLPGFLDLSKVKRRIGLVDPRMLVWLMKRTLALLGWSHHLGIFHGAVLPPHIMVFPDDAVDGRDPRKHTIRLVDWCYSLSKNRTRLSAIVPEYEDFYAPELLNRSLHETSDVYMAAKTILSMGSVPERLNKILEKSLDKNPEKRYKDTREIFNAWVIAAEESYGPPKWTEFKIGE